MISRELSGPPDLKNLKFTDFLGVVRGVGQVVAIDDLLSIVGFDQSFCFHGAVICGTSEAVDKRRWRTALTMNTTISRARYNGAGRQQRSIGNGSI